MNTLKLACITADISTIKKNRTPLYQHLQAHEGVSTVIDASLPDWKKKVLMAYNIHKDKSLWRLNYQWDARRRYWQTKQLARKAKTLPPDINAVLQIGSELTTRTIPQLKNLPTYAYLGDSLMWRFNQLTESLQHTLQVKYLQNHVFEVYTFEALTGILCATEALKQQMMSYFNLPEEKVYTVGCKGDDSQAMGDGDIICHNIMNIINKTYRHSSSAGQGSAKTLLPRGAER